MNTSDRLKFLLPVSVAGYLGCFLVVPGMRLFALFSLRGPLNPGDAILFSAFFLPLAGWGLFRSGKVLRSVRRHNRRNASTLA